ncbi:MAG: AAA family ATPase [Planctomycetes bacterium]|nr:AAA family ATPase [Planctomycetota bacterium]
MSSAAPSAPLPRETGPETCLPPTNLEAERAVLCSVLWDGEALERIASRLAPGDFYRTPHRHVYEAMLSLRLRGEPVLVPSTVTELRTRGLLERVGGADYLADLLGAVDTPAHIVYFAELVRRSAVARRALQLLDDVRRAAYENGSELLALLESGRDGLSALLAEPGDQGGERHWRSFSEISSVAAAAPREWLIPELLPLKGTVLIVGPPKLAGKSTFLWALVGAAQRGGVFLDAELPETRAVIMTEESDHDLADKIERFDLTEAPGLVLSRAAVTALPEFSQAVSDAVAQAQAVAARIIVIDTMAFWMNLADNAENDAGAMTRALRPLQAAADAGHLVLIVHHTGKVPGQEGGYRARGSSALPGGVDSTFEMRGGKGNQRGLCIQTRYAGLQELTVELVEGDDEPPTYRLIGQTADLAVADAVHQILKFIGSVRPAWPTTDEIKSAVTARHDVLGAALRSLVADGRLVRIGKGRRGSPHRFAAPGTPPPEEAQSCDAPSHAVLGSELDSHSQPFPSVPGSASSGGQIPFPDSRPSMKAGPGMESQHSTAPEPDLPDSKPGGRGPWDCPRCGYVASADWKARGCGACRDRWESES